MKKLFIPLIALSALSVATTHANTLLLSDTFPSNFNNFTGQTAGGGSDGLQWSSDAGVGGVSGRINAIGAANHQDWVYYSGSGGAISQSFGQEYGTSILFDPGTVATGHIFEVRTGFLRSSGSNFGGGGSGVWGMLRQDGSGTPFLRLFQQGGQVGLTSASFTLDANLWYELETRMELSNATTASTLGVYLFSRGADGTGARSLVQSVSATNVTIANNGFNQATFWAGFGGGNNTGSNIAAFDNFSVTAIPEPSTYAAFAGVLALGLVLLRRRRSS